MLILVLAQLVLSIIAVVLALKQRHHTRELLAALDSTGRKLSNLLETIQSADRVVADNLAQSVERADATIGPEGAAADAALRTGDTARAIKQRQDDEGA